MLTVCQVSGGEELAVNEVVECEVQLPPGTGKLAVLDQVGRQSRVEEIEALSELCEHAPCWRGRRPGGPGR
jgi:hypothetical protein